jgi:hypothetical protein
MERREELQVTTIDHGTSAAPQLVSQPAASSAAGSMRGSACLGARLGKLQESVTAES